MNYPNISEYTEAIKQSAERLNRLSYLSPVLDDKSEPIFIKGDVSLVFKMKDIKNGRLYALKCYTQGIAGLKDAYTKIANGLSSVTSCYILPFTLYNDEFTVRNENGEESKYPVLVMNWVEGMTLDAFIKSHIQEKDKLFIVTFQFCLLASWLLSQPFAHGSLSPNNILIKKDCSIVLVDYDNIFFPSMDGEQSRENCLKDFHHPFRTKYQFDKRIDDFSLATIALQLYAIAIQPDLFSLSQNNSLLLTRDDYVNLSNSSMFSRLMKLICYEDFEKLLKLFLAAHTRTDLECISKHPFHIIRLHLVGLFDEKNERFIDVFNTIKAAERGDTEAQKILGDFYLDGGRESDYKEALVWYKKAADNGNSKAMGNIGYLYLHGFGVTKDVEEAEKWYARSAEEGNAISQYNLGVSYQDGKGVEENKNKAEALFLKAHSGLIKESKEGNSRSQYTLGLSYLNGYGVKKDLSEAMRWFNAAANRGNRQAQFMVARCYLKEEPIKDYSRAFKWFCISAIQGESNAQRMLGSMYYYGHFVAKNIKESVKWIGLAANQGNARAKFALAVFYYTGQGVQQNYSKAFELFSESSDQGIDVSQKYLAKCYYHGHGVRRDYTEAFKLFSKFANQGHADSQFYLGNCYKEGLGVSKDIPLAIHWYKKATEQGHKDAEKLLSECEEIERKKKEELEVLLKSTEVTDDELKRGIKDEYGVVYSRDRKRLLSANLFRRFTTYKIKPGTLVICDKAFDHVYYNEIITSIYIPDSVKIIGNFAFSGCKSLQSMELPGSITEIGDSAFYNCKKLVSINLPDSITKIGHGVFSSCKLQSLYIPESLAEMGDNPFPSTSIRSVVCRSPYFSVDEHAIYTKDMKEIVSLYKFCNSFCVPNSVTHIRNNAFGGSSLRTVVISDSVKIIGNNAFIGSKLRSIDVPDSVISIGEGAFSFCKSLSKVHLPQSITKIEDYTFHRCEFLQTIEMPSSLSKIGNNAFELCGSLQAITIPNSVTHIGNSAFSCCWSLGLIELPDSLMHIGQHAFSSCKELISIKLPSSIKSIGAGAFSSCNKLESIIIPELITEIEEYTFYGCTNLRNIILSPNLKSIGKYAFRLCEGLKSITLPKTISAIDKTAFDICNNLRTIFVPQKTIKKFEKLLPDHVALLKEIE